MKDPFGKRFFANRPLLINDSFYVAIVTPVIHYCMGGLSIDSRSNVVDKLQHQAIKVHIWIKYIN